MAETPGPTDHPVINRLLAEPRMFTFYQSVRLLERFLGGARIGFQGPPRAELLRFRPEASLGFPPSEVQEITQEKNPWGTSENRYMLTSSFIGLYGPSSPMPAFYTEFIVRPEDIGDYEDRERLRAFMDIFNHRIFSLFYRVLTKYRYHLTFELGGEDAFSSYMLSLIGRGTRGMPADRPIPPIRMVRYSGLLTQQPKSATALGGLLSDFFNGVRVRIQQCVGRWLNVEDTNRIGTRFCELGKDMILGSRVHDRTGKFRISLGPVGLKDFMEFLPNGKRMKELIELVRLYLLDELDFDVEVWLRGNEVPPMALGSTRQPALLGWVGWMSQGPGEDRSVIFRTSTITA